MRKKNGRVVICDNKECNNEFYLNLSRINKTKHNYCSKKCQMEHKTILNIEKIEKKLKIQCLKTWLYQKYINELKTTREISQTIYNNKNNYNCVVSLLRHFDISIRHGSEAIKTQYVGEKYNTRSTIAKFVANEYLNSEETRNKLKKTMQSSEYKQKISIANTGFKNGMYNDKLTEKDREMLRMGRKSSQDQVWRKYVYKKGGYKCNICNSVNNIKAHHINGFNWCKEQRYDVNNGVVLCNRCHKEFHNIYGYGNNTKEQFEEFMLKYKNQEKAS